MGSGFKRKKIPRELILGPPPRKPRWWLWLSLAFGFAAAALFAMTTIAKPLEAGTGELLFKTDADGSGCGRPSDHALHERSGEKRQSLRDGEVAMDRDFVLEWRPTADARPRAADPEGVSSPRGKPHTGGCTRYHPWHFIRHLMNRG